MAVLKNDRRKVPFQKYRLCLYSATSLYLVESWDEFSIGGISGIYFPLTSIYVNMDEIKQKRRKKKQNRWDRR